MFRRPNIEAMTRSKSNLAFEDSYPFFDQIATIKTSSEKLSGDVLFTAKSEGLDKSTASRFLETTNFSFLPSREAISFSPHAPTIMSRILDSFPSEKPLGFVYSDSETHKTYCNLDIEQMIEQICSGRGKRNFRIPRTMSPEASQAALTQMIDKVWIHEKRHLLQDMQPPVMYRKKDTQNKHHAVSKVGQIMYATGTVILLSAIAIPMESKSKNILMSTSGGLVILSSFISAINTNMIDYKSFHEKEAYTAALSDSNTPSPFTIGFEKAST